MTAPVRNFENIAFERARFVIALNSPRKQKCQAKHYCASNEQQAEISDGIARNLACAGLYVTCADIKSVRAARRWYFHRPWNKNLPIAPTPRCLSVHPRGRTN